MALTFADTHNMLTYLTKSDASEGFEQILDFLNTNDVIRLQALIDRRKVIITEDTVRQVLRSDDAESIYCLPNEEIFAELERMGLVRNVDSSSKFYMYPRFLQLMIDAQQVNDEVADDAADDVADVVVDAVAPTPPPLLHQSPIAPPSSPSQQQQPSQPSHTTDISMDLLKTLLETCTTLTKKVKALEQDKIAQALEITKLKQKVRKLEKKSKLKVSGRMHPNRGKIVELDADEDVTLEEVGAKVEKDAKVTKDDDEAEPAELKEVIEVVTTAKLMTEVVTLAATTITAAPSAARRRKGVVIRDPEETTTPSIIVHSEPKSKDKGKGILVEEPKPLKKQAQIEQDKAYARVLEAKLNASINLDDVIEQVKGKEKQDNAVLRYQALKRKPQTKAQARKNMMVYLENMDGFKMDFFKGMSYDDIRPIFEKHFNSIMGFLEKSEKELEEEASKVLKRKSESLEQQAAKKQKLDEEVKELKTHLQIVPNNENDVYTEVTPLALKMHQPWRTFAALINRSLSGMTTGLNKLRLSKAQILWGMYHQKNVDYVELLWEEFIYHITNKAYKKMGKSKRVKRPAKKSTQVLEVVIRETPKIPVSKKKEKVDVCNAPLRKEDVRKMYILRGRKSVPGIIAVKGETGKKRLLGLH
nr:hypothetical protein [Tanacetum cinerariifolium]